MDNPARLVDQRVAIVGLGLMGGSLALGLRGKCAALLGIDIDAHICTLAVQEGVVEQAAVDPLELLPQANLVILATPVRSILDLIPRLAELHPGTPVVLDLGSTKVQIAAALEALPARFSAVGGHPMCGKETNSLLHADPAIYHAAPFVLTRLQNSSDMALSLVEQVALAIGARPIWLPADVHDRWVAATSHLPYLLANALAWSVPRQAAPVVGTGFRSTARLAPSSRRVMLDILQTNRENILISLEDLGSRLEALTIALESEDYPTLEKLLSEGAAAYSALGEPIDPLNPAPTQSDLSLR